MRVADFDYDLPSNRIAQVPIEPRDAARMLVDRGSDAPEHRHVHDLVELLGPGDLLVVNDSRVIPARLLLRRSTGGAVEVLILEPLDPQRRRWDALVRPARRLRDGEVLFDANEQPRVMVHGRRRSGDTFEVEILGTENVDQVLDEVGQMPLPPYITEPLSDDDRYQTVYARQPGSAAAPTAGLHFTEQLLEQLRHRGVGIAAVELMVGLDTFRPIDVEDPADHPMHRERFRVPDDTFVACESADRVIAVGTTVVRALETAALGGFRQGQTDLFIRRGHDWKVVDLLLTNFHLPRTTLLMMIDAFIGPRWRRLYEVALEHQYRFLSFGDAMLLDRRAR